MRILLAIDDSKFSEAATQAVIAQYDPQGTQVKILNVVDLQIPIPTSYAAGFREESLKHGQEVVRRAEQTLNRAGYTVQTAVEEGDPKSKIIDQATQWDAELIVLGSHGRKGIDRFLMGSVAEGVARHASCSVQIVRIPTEAPTHLAISSGGIQMPIPLEHQQHKQVCKVCGKPSSNNICPVCADKIRAEAIARKKREDKGEE